jgi:molybdopterin converting factor small subunit
VIDLGQVADTLEATVAALAAPATQADVMMTSGGVSVGEEDHVKARSSARPARYVESRHEAGQTAGLRPRRHADFIGLPGNPVSAFVVFCLFVAPFLRNAWAPCAARRSFTVPAGFDRAKPGKRREFLRARLEDGRAVLFPNQSSGVLTSLAWADGLVDVDAGVTVAAGDPVRFIPSRSCCHELINVLYFARLREVFGLGSETARTARRRQRRHDLLALLRQRGGVWAENLAPRTRLPGRVAVNQDVANADTRLKRPRRSGDLPAGDRRLRRQGDDGGAAPLRCRRRASTAHAVRRPQGTG